MFTYCPASQATFFDWPQKPKRHVFCYPDPIYRPSHSKQFYATPSQKIATYAPRNQQNMYSLPENGNPNNTTRYPSGPSAVMSPH